MSTQRLHSFKFTLVNKSHLQHSVDAVLCLGRHFLILYACATKSRSQTKDHYHQSGSEIVHRRNGQLPVRMAGTVFPKVYSLSPPVTLVKAYEHHIGKALKIAYSQL